ncbi:YceI family protein [Pollutibacter soli]|uniref:YceI family protein n=1 Tax=Pollutibacter soli TaxID=3034157 RepID=UPI003013B5D6
MQKITLIATIGLFILTQSQNMKPVDEGSAVKFRIKNFGGTVIGSFKGLNGTMHFNPADLSSASFDVTVDVNTINTGINMRNNDLKEEKYFDVKNFPKIRLVSSKITKAKDGVNSFEFTGELTIKGTKKTIQFPFTTSQANGGTMFKAEFPLNRRDFNVGGSSISLSDNLTVSLAVLGK